ncbi:hypothetical protein OH456_20410 [Vibrio sp. La 4.2.2]|uniref:glycosyltransferase family protein n=1 Tax=Vibrio sp. La 4.2.2 TaxID=2998830 RepID=UPI0022CE2E74|nr:hypothetical protein [Vibrio sp. La 4.2.2]MDA0110531.1 hypothetical protein [Vibrio sp. La 4.2.2]
MKFAVLADWPEVKNAEYEVIKRIQLAADRCGYECLVIDPQGLVIELNDQGYEKLGPRVCDLDKVSFVLNLHFASPKVFDKFTFATTWNPPPFFFDWGYPVASRQFATADDYLVYNSKPILSHLHNLIGSSRRNIDEALHMVPSVPYVEREVLHGLDSNSPKVFYSGINWERIANKNGRHHELFQLLDQQGFMRFHGPELFLGHKPWAGFKSFYGEIPFDGVSTIKVIQECGISLVLSSDVHRDSHAATNRLYESLEAGAIIISDDNKFVMDNFGDVVLPISYSKNYEETCNQIVSHVNWIKANPDEAKQLAKKGHERYREIFGLEHQLKTIVNSFDNRKKQVESICQVTEGDVETTTVIVDATAGVDKEQLAQTLISVDKQTYPKVKTFVVVETQQESELQSILENLNGEYYIKTVDQESIGTTVEKQRIILKGRVLQEIAAENELSLTLYMVQGDVIFSNHLSSLAYPIINEGADAVCSGWITEDSEGKREVEYFGEPAARDNMISLAHRPRLSALMFRYKKSFNTWYLDEELPSVFSANAAINNTMAFSNSPTTVIKDYKVQDRVKFDLIKQLETIRDTYRFNPHAAIAQSGGGSTNVILTDELFVRTQKRIMWDFFSKYPKFQRVCQKIFRFIKGVFKK